jgi:hypothetical protein
MPQKKIKTSMNYQSHMRFLFAISCCFFISVSQAQDTTKKKTIEITSTFKPVLREPVKIIFNAAAPVVDSAKARLNYDIPQQNLMLGYQPAALKPVALQIDSMTAWQYSNYIKVGLGNIHIPYVQAGFSFGDGKNSFFNVFANQFTSKGKLPFQKNSLTGVSAMGTMKTAANLEWNGKIGFNSNDFFLYGYQPSTISFTKDQLRQRLQTIEGKLSLRNMEPTEFGLTYNPNIRVSVFSGENNKNKGTEANSVLNLPLTKTFGKSLAINLGFTANLTNYRPTGKKSVNNNIYYVSPALLLKTPNLFIHGGLTPSWDNKVFTLLPDIMVDVTTNDQRFTAQFGWIGYYDKGSYERFAGINPWIAQPNQLLNTRIQERYAGFKGSVLDHISYSAKVGFVQYRNMPLFVNDTADGKTFYTEYTSSMEALQLHGEIALTKGENFSWNTGLTWNQFTKVRDHIKAYGLIPFEVNSTLRWQIFKEFYFKSELFLFDGAAYRVRTTPGKFDSRKGKAAVDLNAGIEFRITKNFNLWLQMNNLFNKRYQRWNQYEVFGFNILGGIIYTFNNK